MEKKAPFIPYLVLFAFATLTFSPLNGEEPQVTVEPALSTETNITPQEVKAVKPGEVTGSQVPYCIHFDPAKWEVTKEINNPAAEFSFKRKGEAVYAFVIPEANPVSLEMMPQVIVYNATSKGMKDIKIVQKEVRTVAGKEVLFIEWEGAIGELNTKVSYLGYIFTGQEGTVQFYTFTMSNFKDMYNKDMMEILNSLCFTPVKA